METDTLKERIEAVISQWRTRTDLPPPFTLAELIVVALVLENKPMTALSICQWIWVNFAFYSELGGAAVWKYWLGRESIFVDDLELRECRPRLSGFQRALYDYNVPIVPVHDRGESEDPEERWKVDPACTMLFLRHRLWPEAKRLGSFPFLRLPPEMRNRVYEMVFAFPPSGIRINHHEADGSGAFAAATRSFEQPFDFRHWERGGHTLHVARISEVLSVLQVNRQIRSEALYIFPGINTFVFSSASHLLHVLERMSQQHRDSLRDIAFLHVPSATCASALTRAFTFLATMKRLRRLRIHVDQQEFGNYYSFKRDRPINSMGFNRAMRISQSVEVILDGDCPNELMGQIRSDPDVLMMSLEQQILPDTPRSPPPPASWNWSPYWRMEAFRIVLSISWASLLGWVMMKIR